MSSLSMRLLRVVVLAALVGGSHAASAGRSAAQHSGLQGDDTYVSPKFGFEVVWGGSWTYLDESEAESGADRDHIDLISAEFLAMIHITALTDVIDPEEQLAITIDNQQEGLEAAGEEFEILGERSGRDYEAAALEYTIGDETDQQYIEIADLQDRAGEDGTLVLQMMAIADGAADAFADLRDNVTLDGDPIVLGDLEETIAGAGAAQDDRPSSDDEIPATRESGLDGNAFTDEQYGWSVEWDERVWEAEEAEGGVLLFSGDDAAARLIVYEDGITNAGDCLDDLDRAFTSNDDWDGLAESRRLDPPATASDAEGQLYTGTLVAVDPELDVALYLECREVADATLSVAVWVAEDRFEDMLPDIEDLLAAVATGGPVQDNGSSGDDGIDGNTYTNTEYGFVVEWDDREWTVDDPANFIGIEFSREVRDGGSYGGVSVRTDIDGTDGEACVETIRGELERDGAITELDDSPRLDLPETDADAVGAVFEFIYTLDGDELDLVSYVECRALSGGEALVFRFTADAASYEDQLDDVAGFLAGIQIDAGSASVDDEPSGDVDSGDSKNDIAAGEIDDAQRG